MPGLQNLWRAVRRFLLSEETLPRLLISKAVTVVLICVMSVTKCAYLFDLSVFRWAMFTSSGTVSSNMWNLLFTLSQMVMSGLRLVTVTSGGNSTSPRRLVSLDITVYCELCCVQTIHHIVHNVVMSPGPSAGFHGHFADIETVCSSLAPLAQFALVRGGLFPPLQISSCGQCVNVCICQQFECALSDLIEKTFPCKVCGFSCC